MNDKYIYSIGLMSGTSLDGLDIVYAKFHKKDYSDFEIIHSNTIKYSEFWEARLKNSIHLDTELLFVLDYDYGQYLGNKTKEFISKNKIDLTPEINIDQLLAKVKAKYQAQPINEVDGLKIEFDKEWVHLRRSNTEAIIRIYSESQTAQAAQALAEKIINDIKEFIK